MNLQTNLLLLLLLNLERRFCYCFWVTKKKQRNKLQYIRFNQISVTNKTDCDISREPGTDIKNDTRVYHQVQSWRGREISPLERGFRNKKQHDVHRSNSARVAKSYQVNLSFVLNRNTVLEYLF